MSDLNQTESIKPFVINYEEANKMQQASMVPSDKGKKKSAADDLVIDDEGATEKPKNGLAISAKSEEKKKSIVKGGLQKMFEILPPGSNDPTRKLYLVLLIIISNTDNVEDEHTFKFVKGRQETYDYIKGELESGVYIDCMHSQVIVDSPKISISKGISVYSFMKDMRGRGNVIDISSFDIEDYFYDIEDAEEGED